MTPDAYRAKWGLPLSSPLVAPYYAKRRSDIAKMIGVGRKKRQPANAGRRKPRG